MRRRMIEARQQGGSVAFFRPQERSFLRSHREYIHATIRTYQSLQKKTFCASPTNQKVQASSPYKIGGREISQ